MRSVVITGASTGIGRAAAQHLANRSWTVFAGVRKQSDAEELQKADNRIRPLILDVTDRNQLDQAVAAVSRELQGETLGGLVNNAGIANMGPLALQSMDQFRAHFDVNVFGLLQATQAFLPMLGTDRHRTGVPGRIVNITSVGGKLASPFLGAYTATKHAVESMTDSLRRELVVFGIDAIAVGPGAVRTPIWDKAETANEDEPYADSAWGDALEKFSDVMLKGGRDGLPAERIAQVIETALTSKSPKARYAPVPNKLTNFTIPLLLPKRFVDRVFWRRFGLERR